MERKHSDIPESPDDFATQKEEDKDNVCCLLFVSRNCFTLVSGLP